MLFRSSPLSVGSGAGARFAPEHYAGSPPGAGSDPRFVLYAGDRAKGAALAAKFPVLLQSEARTAAEPDRITIVRPDGYVGFVGGEEDFVRAADYLQPFAA